jgi:hypothetical protein
MDNHESSPASVANWTIKNMSVEVRLEAIACAARAGLSVAQWLAHAVRTQAQLEAGPVAPSIAAVPRRGPVVVAAEPASDAPPLSHMSKLLRETRASFQAAGAPLPVAIAAAAAALSLTMLREAKQSSRARSRAAKPPKTEGPTEIGNGQTLSLEHSPEV